MFSRKNKGVGSQLTNQEPAQPAKPAVPSIISANLVMTGDLNSDGEIQVDGTVIGDIRTKSLLIGKTANVKGDIIAEDIRVHGNVNGQIMARRVNLEKTAHVMGDILHENLTIETGAFLEGLCKHMSDTELTDTSKINLVNKAPGNYAPSNIMANDPKKVAS